MATSWFQRTTMWLHFPADEPLPQSGETVEQSSLLTKRTSLVHIARMLGQTTLPDGRVQVKAMVSRTVKG